MASSQKLPKNFRGTPRVPGWAIGVQSPAGAKDFSSNLCVQTGSGAHPASCPMGTGGPFPGGKARSGRDADHSPPSIAGVLNEEDNYFTRQYISEDNSELSMMFNKSSRRRLS
jgi:hypothetical protein